MKGRIKKKKISYLVNNFSNGLKLQWTVCMFKLKTCKMIKLDINKLNFF